ncbi:MAG: WhiB family transcriptional regulator [Streptomycetaceae bacterium]|nr:WhiB family transcriptional regulator [Streptomycetaceae bacterium]
MSADRYAWMDQALCAQADPDLWADPIGGNNATTKRICGHCPARLACAAHAERLHDQDGTTVHGTWGGHSRNQRNQQRRNERREAA